MAKNSCGTSPSHEHVRQQAALAAFGADARQVLRTVIEAPAFRGQLPAGIVAGLMTREGSSIDRLMLDLLPVARTFSSPLLSGFQVGAVVQGISGSLYFGANIEFPGHALGLTVHAEQASLANAYMSSESGIVSLAVTAVPCGMCRQFLQEMSLERDVVVLLKGQPPVNLSTLLPMAFGPQDLDSSHGAFPIREIGLSLTVPSQDALVLAALGAARRSYAPYTFSYSGVALITEEQQVFTGTYIENAAFNPSLSPAQTALGSYYASRWSASPLVSAVLVEVEGAKISQASSTRAVLASIAPTARLEVVFVRT